MNNDDEKEKENALLNFVTKAEVFLVQRFYSGNYIGIDKG